MTLKVSDFGLSSDIKNKDYYKTDDTSAELPVRWMSPESQMEWIFTTKSDVVCSQSSSVLVKSTIVWIRCHQKIILFSHLEHKRSSFCSGHLVFCCGRFIPLLIFLT